MGEVCTSLISVQMIYKRKISQLGKCRSGEVIRTNRILGGQNIPRLNSCYFFFHN